MLNQSKPHLKEIAEQEGYRKGELIRSEQVKVYIAKDDLVKLDENTKRSRCQTLVAAKINQETGVDAPSFDGTINTMNRIQEAIIWGGGES
jgi:Holliday junction resolvase